MESTITKIANGIKQRIKNIELSFGLTLRGMQIKRIPIHGYCIFKGEERVLLTDENFGEHDAEILSIELSKLERLLTNLTEIIN